MTAPGFVHLHVHTEYSLIDSVVRLPGLVAATAAAGMPAVAITDQGNLFALVKFYRQALDAGIKPLIGAEVWVTGREEQAEAARLVLLCRNGAGYRSLSRLLSRAWLEGQNDGIPQVHASWFDGGATSGLIALSGGQDGVLGRALLGGPPERAERAAAAYSEWFGGDFYVELQRTGRPHENAYVEAATLFASMVGLPVVATNDVRFLKPDDFDAHEARVCIQQGRTLADPGRPRLYSEQQYLRTPEEMQLLFADLPEALANSVEIAKRCNVTLSLGETHLPDYAVPNGLLPADYLREQAEAGLAQRLSETGPGQVSGPVAGYQQRLADELAVICRMGFAGYFLIVADFIRWAKEHEIPVGPGRGSGAGSLVAWVLGITDLDPIRYDLRFERSPFEALSTDSRSACWVADHPPRPLDFPALASACDVFFPRIFLRRGKLVPIGTVSLNIYFHADSAALAEQGASPMLGSALCHVYQSGYFDQHGELWGRGERLLATTHQIVWYRE